MAKEVKFQSAGWWCLIRGEIGQVCFTSTSFNRSSTLAFNDQKKSSLLHVTQGNAGACIHRRKGCESKLAELEQHSWTGADLQHVSLSADPSPGRGEAGSSRQALHGHSYRWA